MVCGRAEGWRGLLLEKGCAEIELIDLRSRTTYHHAVADCFFSLPWAGMYQQSIRESMYEGLVLVLISWASQIVRHAPV